MTLADTIAAAYEGRKDLLQCAADKLELRLREALSGFPHIDRVSFRVKGTSSFCKKCIDSDGALRCDESGAPHYSEPLEEIEDQIAGRILVFFRDDLSPVEDRVREWFRAAVEVQHKRPTMAAAFGYESDHFIFVIDEHMKPAGWDEAGPMPTTFELQVRTLFMHAYAEPQHDIGYKAGSALDEDLERQFAWIAASAWGADRTMNDLYRQSSDDVGAAAV